MGADDRVAFLVGAWDLTEATIAGSDGSAPEPWGPSPVGVLVFAADGTFAVQAMRRERATFEGAEPSGEEKQRAYDDYFSYFGRRERFEDGTESMISRVEGALNPNMVGGEQVRYLEIEDDDHIVLRTPPRTRGGSQFVGTFRWRRRR
jgi:hypothetical protein